VNDLKASTRQARILQHQAGAREQSALLRLPTELRQQILKQLLWPQLHATLKLWAVSVEQHTRSPSSNAARSAPRSHQTQAQAQTQPFLQTLRAVASTCTMLRGDLIAALPPLTANMLGRWSASVRQGHRGLYEHMVKLIADGWLDRQNQDDDENEDEGKQPPIRTMDAALARQPVAANALYQQMASRLLYEEPSEPLFVDAASAGTRTKPRSVLAILAEGMHGVLRFEWMLSVRRPPAPYDSKVSSLTRALRADPSARFSTITTTYSLDAGLCARSTASSNSTHMWGLDERNRFGRNELGESGPRTGWERKGKLTMIHDWRQEGTSRGHARVSIP